MGRDLAQRAEAAVQQQNGNGQQTLGQQIMAMKTQFQMAMPSGAEAGQLVRDALTVLRGTPKLADCTPDSVLGALMTCAQLGLRPGVAGLGHAWLLPMRTGYGQDRHLAATLIIGYRGYIELAYRHDKVTSIASRVVYSNDQFDLSFGIEGDTLVHRPALDGPRGEPRLYYALARLKGGYALTEPWTQADMEAHRDRFAMAKKDGKVVGPWRDHFVEMARKSMIRGPLLKMLPLSTELAVAASVDEGVRVDLTPDADLTEVTRPVVAVEIENDQPPAVEGDQEKAAIEAANNEASWPETPKPGEG